MQLRIGAQRLENNNSFIHSGYFYSASSSPILLRGAPDTARILCRSSTPKRHRQLQVKDLPKVSTWRLERDSSPRPFGRKASTLPMGYHAPVPMHSDSRQDFWTPPLPCQ